MRAHASLSFQRGRISEAVRRPTVQDYLRCRAKLEASYPLGGITCRRHIAWLSSFAYRLRLWD
jgi:hypothetical protein